MTDLRDQLAEALANTHRIERELGRGGMSRVFLAEELALQRKVVVKVLSPDLAADVNVDRFHQEIQLSATLQHPNIVPLLSAGTLDALPYYIMPFVEGRSLRDMVAERGAIPIREAVSILRDIARALAAAHDRNIIHRDIKPDNVMLTSGVAMVIDFGVAKAVSSSRRSVDANLTGLGMSIGTPAYMAPEQAAADPAADHRVDLYAFGVLAYELLAGRPPFTGTTPQALIIAHLTEAPQPLDKVQPDVPQALADLIMGCIEKDPADRPATANAVLDGLEDPTAISGTVSAGFARAPHHSRRGIRRAGWLTAGVVLALAVAFLARGASPEIETVPAGPSVAVLTFVVIGGDTADTYFADGMADELIAALGTVPGLRVASRTAAFAYRDQHATPSEIGRALNVGTLLEGTVRREQDQLRVTVSLVDVDDGLTRWSERYQRQAADVFAVQDDIAQAIVVSLQSELGENLPTVAPKRGTTDLTAYDAYLRGRHFFHKRGEASLLRALQYFQDAVSQDSTYALAYSGMADVYGLLPLYSDAYPGDSLVPLGLAAASAAIRLDSTLAEAYASRASLRNSLWQWDGAGADYRTAIALKPNYSTAHQWYGEHLLVIGRIDDAVAALSEAARLDPLAPIIAGSYALALGTAGRDSMALRVARRAVELDSSLAATRLMLGAVHLYGEQPEQAIPHLEAALEILGANATVAGMLGYAYAKSGRIDEARALLVSADPGLAGNAPAMARIYLGLGETSQAIAALDLAANRRDPYFSSQSLASPLLDPLRALPEFRLLIESVGLDADLLVGEPR
jgi:TolB-like protein/Tfp pilus assembly protein PilF/tRNA A-37 threonylcarbamoyl transferase component Bud32